MFTLDVISNDKNNNNKSRSKYYLQKLNECK